MKLRWLLAAVLGVVELALGAVIVLTLWQSIGLVRTDGLRVNFFETDKVRAEADEEQRADVTGPAALQVSNKLGNVTVTGGAAQQIVISAHKTAWGANQAEADARLAQLKVNVTQTGDTVTVEVESPQEVFVGGRQQTDRVNFVISVPEETAVTAQTGFGDIALSGTGRDADLRTGNGAIQASDLAGNLNLNSSFGDITVERAMLGQVEAHSNNGKVQLNAVTASGTVSLSSNFGDLRFEGGGAASLDLKSDNGAIWLNDLTVGGPVAARSSFGDVTLTGVAARAYTLHSDNGNITVDGAAGPLQVDSNFGDIGISHGQDATLDLKTTNGKIEYAGSLGEGPHVVKSNFGDLTLTLPAETALAVDLKTDFGHIETALPITVAGSADQSHMQGTMNGGGANLTATTNNGNITLGILGS
jgi:DUF4097 and DUF4098 domain-containing protein YvlB